MSCENCGHDQRISHFARLGQIVCLDCNDCIREYTVIDSQFIEGDWLVRKKISFYQWMIRNHRLRGNSLGELTRDLVNKYWYYPDFPKRHLEYDRVRRFLLRHDRKVRGIEIFDEMYCLYFNSVKNKWLE